MKRVGTAANGGKLSGSFDHARRQATCAPGFFSRRVVQGIAPGCPAATATLDTRIKCARRCARTREGTRREDGADGERGRMSQISVRRFLERGARRTGGRARSRRMRDKRQVAGEERPWHVVLKNVTCRDGQARRAWRTEVKVRGDGVVVRAQLSGNGRE